MKTASGPKLRPEPSRTTIDLAWAGIESDGTTVYAPPPEAAMRLVGQGLGWLLVKYPHGTAYGLALATVGAACAFFARGAIQQDSASKCSRR